MNHRTQHSQHSTERTDFPLRLPVCNSLTLLWKETRGNGAKERVRATQFCPRFQCPIQPTTDIQDASNPRKLKLSYRQEALWYAPFESVLAFKPHALIKEKFLFFRGTGFPSRMTIFCYSFAPLQISASLVLFLSCLILSSLSSVFGEDWSDKENVAMGDIIILMCARPNIWEAHLWAMLSFLSIFFLSLKIFLWTVLRSVSKCQNSAANDKSEIYIYDFCKFIPSVTSSWAHGWQSLPRMKAMLLQTSFPLPGTTFSADRTLLSAVSYNPYRYAHVFPLLSCNRKVCNCRWKEQHILHTTHLQKIRFSLPLPPASPLPPSLSWEHWLINNPVHAWKKETVPLYF